MTTIDDQGLAFAGVARLAQLVRDREVSPQELVTLYLERIAQLDPALNAFRVVLADHAMAEAAQVERRLAAGEDLPLAGVPIAVKDDTDVAGVSSLVGIKGQRGAAELHRATGHVDSGRSLARRPVRSGPSGGTTPRRIHTRFACGATGVGAPVGPPPATGRAVRTPASG